MSLTASNPRVILSCPHILQSISLQSQNGSERLLRYLVYTGQVRAYRTLSYTLFSHIPPVMAHTYEPLSLFKLFIPHNFLPLAWTLSSDRRMICTLPLRIFKTHLLIVDKFSIIWLSNLNEVAGDAGHCDHLPRQRGRSRHPFTLFGPKLSPFFWPQKT